MRFILRSLVILLALYGLVFAIGNLYLAEAGAPLWTGIIFAVVFVGFQYLVGPYLISWLLDILWLDVRGPDDTLFGLPATASTYIKALCAERGLKVPRIGIISSGTPNAFTFGHVPGNARLVLTTGLIDVLTPDELNAVIAHEIGHVEHWDFVVMTIASLVPLLLYQMYVLLRRDRSGGPIAIGAYVAYIVSQFVVLALNRTREYFADHYSACVTKQPGALQSALVKIAVGLVKSEGEYARTMAEDNADAKKHARRDHRLAGTIAVMGISNVRSGTSLVLGSTDPAAAIRVMQWELVNPWARLYELSSTHPLTARRVRALNAEATALHQAPAYPMAERPSLNWGWFPLEVVLWAAPMAGIITIALGAALRSTLHTFGIELPAGQLPILVVFTGVTWMLRVLYRYHGTPERQTIGRLIEDLDVSEMRPRAVRIEGTVLGRGVPGAFWSPDLVVQDDSGMIFMRYRQSIPFARFFFAVTTAEELRHQKVTIEGWYRRGLRPYIEMSKLTTADGRTYRAWSRWIQLAVAACAVALGLMWM